MLGVIFVEDFFLEVRLSLKHTFGERVVFSLNAVSFFFPHNDVKGLVAEDRSRDT